jgi:hypothetical protein
LWGMCFQKHCRKAFDYKSAFEQVLTLPYNFNPYFDTPLVK